MKAFSIQAPGEIAPIVGEAQEISAGLVKVRVTHAALTENDFLLYRRGEGLYPIIPSRSAIGVISESEEGGRFHKGDKVYLKPNAPCGNCFECRSGKPKECKSQRCYGENTDGFLRDFITLPEDNLVEIPPQADPVDLLLTESVSMAIAAIDALGIEKGEHIVVMGATPIGNLLCQLALYYQAIPILFDTDEERLQQAKAMGVYYAFHADTDIIRHVKQATAGRMARYVAYVSGSGIEIDGTLECLSSGGRLALLGCGAEVASAPLGTVLSKKLTVFGISDGYKEIASAINLLVSADINTEGLFERKVRYVDVPALFEEVKGDKLFNRVFVVDCLAD
ncbi:MAG: zinc-binding dehydrogenase [Clostridia bacterium]|nr:zinc-binding dehydrogenase [Clostridia bacterium]